VAAVMRACGSQGAWRTALELLSEEERAAASRDEPAPQKDARKMLVNHIYDTMVAKGFTSPNGHLLMDVFVEVWRGVNGQQGSAGGGKTALDRFAGFLEGAPELFEVFDLDILPMSWATGMDMPADDKPPECRERMIKLKPRGGLNPGDNRQAAARPGPKAKAAAHWR
jgi:hypothetical protein